MILCASSHRPLAAHHRPASGASRADAGAASDRLALKSSTPTTISPPFFWCEPSRRLLDHLTEREQRLFIERPADQLQAERQALRVLAGGKGNTCNTPHVPRHREQS